MVSRGYKRITRRDFIREGIAISAALAGCFTGCDFSISKGKGRPYKQPNIVFVTIDTTRYDRIGFNGYRATTTDGQRLSTTPFLDKIAEQGVVFEKNFCQAPKTIPSTASFMTSRYPKEMKVESQLSKIPRRFPTLAQILRDAGYQTFGAVSASHINKKRGFGRGFGFFSMPTEPYDEAEIGAWLFTRDGDKTMQDLTRGIDAAERDKPSFYWLHLFDPHTGYVAPPQFTSRFKSTGEFDDVERRFLVTLDLIITEKEAVERSDQYDGQILFADYSVSGLMDYLTRNDRFDFDKGDLFILNADHGELLLEHGHCGHHLGSYEEVAHTPLMIAGGGLPKNKKVSALTMNLDIVPTILDMLGSRDIEKFRGKSLLDVVNNQKATHHDCVFLYYTRYCSVRTNEHKLNKYLEYKETVDDRTSEGYSPSGGIDFFGDDIVLRWPSGLESHDQDTTLEIEVYKVSPDAGTERILHETRPYDGSDGFNLSAAARGTRDNESLWREYAENAKMAWSVKLLSEAEASGDRPEVLFDSRLIEFRLKPIYPVDELYDLADVPRETINQYDNQSYSDVRKRLETLVAERIGIDESQSSKPLVVEIDEKERSALKALGYLR